MSIRFEWDANKAQSNLQKHGVSFDEATGALDDPLSRTIPDPYAWHEHRYVTIGRTLDGRLLVVIHADRGDTIRLISARPATPSEHRTYGNQSSS